MNDLILYEQGNQVGIRPDVVRLKESALTQSALIGKVCNTDQQLTASAAAQSIHDLLALVEESRKALKEPHLVAGQRIDKLAREFSEELKAEEARVNLLIGEYVQHEQAKLRDAVTAANDALTELEQRRFKELAAAKDDDERDAINLRYNDEANQISEQMPKVEKVAGQTAKPDWEITVTDVHQLYRFHSNCVELKPINSAIKELLDAGVSVRGVTAKQIVKVSQRKTKPEKAIEV